MRHPSDTPEDVSLPDATGMRIAIVVSRFNDSVTTRLRDGAIEALTVAGAAVDAIETFEVPGAYEVPFAARAAASSGHFDAIVCLGCLIRGETPHFEVIAHAVAHGLMTASMESGVPMAFGVLTTNTPEQALERAAMDRSNKGWEAAVTAIEMAHLVRRLAAGDGAS